ncbi:VPS37 C-terminal domain-containing protein [Aphelenchoides bicaudatus]|nr:VPS37 C-terminal domain-containing protein [Aphelenchoides bicaudatus]
MTLDFNGVIDAYSTAIRRLLSDLDNEQLQELLKDPAKLDKLIKDQDQINLLPELKDNKLRHCKWIADSNMSLKPKFEELKTSLGSTAAELRVFNHEIQQMKHQLDLEADSRRLDVADSVLTVAVRQAEEVSEKISDNFLAGRLPIDDFITKFDESRRLYHMRQLKAQKLSELLRYQQY